MGNGRRGKTRILAGHHLGHQLGAISCAAPNLALCSASGYPVVAGVDSAVSQGALEQRIDGAPESDQFARERKRRWLALRRVEMFEHGELRVAHSTGGSELV